MSNHGPSQHVSSSSPSSSSSVTDTPLGYFTSALSIGQEAFEISKGFGHKATEQLSYAAAQAQVQAHRTINYISGQSSSAVNDDLFGSGYGHGAANRQTNYGDWSGSRSFSLLPQYRSQIEPNNSQSCIGNNGHNNGGNHNNSSGQTSHHCQETGPGDPAEKQRWSHNNSDSYSSHHYAAAHPSFKSSQGGL
ncbi:hypothetical protein BGZ93_009136 [Podila epicladia]|nr:hypothetical protein BGZ93_009136 [Podila epicladia]